MNIFVQLLENKKNLIKPSFFSKLAGKEKPLSK